MGGGSKEPPGVDYLHVGCKDGVSLIHEFEEVGFGKGKEGEREKEERKREKKIKNK